MSVAHPLTGDELHELARQKARQLTTQQRREGYWPEALHRYDDATGYPVFWRIRMKHATRRKWIKPLIVDAHGQWKLAEPEMDTKPLYRLPAILNSSGPIYVVEGEKCADAMAKRGYIVTTSGSNVTGIDWSSLKGRVVIIWPDNDAAGTKYLRAVCEALDGVASEVHVIDVAQLGLPEKGDVVNWLDEPANTDGAAIDALPTIEASTGDQGASVGQSVRPLPPGRPSVQPFPMELLPDPLRPWIEDMAQRIQCPPDYPAVTAIVTLSSLIGRQVGIRPKRHDDWTVVPNLWGMTIGRPSSKKSPSMGEALKPLEQLVAAARRAHEQHQAEYKAGEMVREANEKHRRDEIRKLTKQGKQGEANQLAGDMVSAESEKPPTATRYKTSDTTVEKLGELLAENPRGMLIFRDELRGFLNSLGKENRETDRAFYIESWNGNVAFDYDRIGRGHVFIEAACTSIIGGIQPGPMEQYVRAAIRGGKGDDGLIQRFQLTVWPDLDTWQKVDRPPDAEAQGRAYAVFEALEQINPEAIDGEMSQNDAFPALRFSAAAQDHFDEWYCRNESRLRDGALPAPIESHLAKFPSLVASLALILHLVSGQTGAVSERPLLQALAWVEYLETHALRLYAPATAGPELAAREIARRIIRGDLVNGFTAREITRKGWSGLADSETVSDALEVLTDLGGIVPEITHGGGRPRQSYWIRPAAYEVWQL